MLKRNVLWIASFPKSGNTWIHSVLRLAGKDYGFPQADLDVYNVAREGKEPIICHAVQDKFSENPCVVLKTHSPYKAHQQLHQIPNIKLLNTAYIHIYRNPLDVLLSYLNFTRIEYKFFQDDMTYKKYLFIELLGMPRTIEHKAWLNMSLDDIPQKNLDHALGVFSENMMMIEGLKSMSGSWIENTMSWMNAAGDLPGVSIRYEDCLEDPAHFVKLAEFFKCDRNDVAAALHSVNNQARSWSTGRDFEKAAFFNKMKAYYFIDYFSTHAIGSFLVKHEDVLRLLGFDSLFNLVHQKSE